MPSCKDSYDCQLEINKGSNVMDLECNDERMRECDNKKKEGEIIWMENLQAACRLW